MNSFYFVIFPKINSFDFVIFPKIKFDLIVINSNVYSKKFIFASVCKKMEGFDKQYYSISETAEMFGVKTSLLRSWEKEFELLKPFKNQKGTRFFTQKDIEIIRTIIYLTKEKGYTLHGAKEAIRENFVKAATQAEMVHKLNTVKLFLLEIKNNL